MKQIHVLILGASGMLGSMLLDVLSQNKSMTIYATTRDKKSIISLRKRYPQVIFFPFDTPKDTFKNLLKQIKRVDWVINAIGKIKPTIPDNSPEIVSDAVVSNILLPIQIAQAINKTKIRALQIATDCVFSENHPHASEKDMHDAVDTYGKTKSLGEIHTDGFYNLRCSIIGPESFNNRSLLEWFLSSKKNAKISGFTNHIWNGITTLQFVKICEAIIENNIYLTSIQHIVPKNEIRKEKLLHLFSKAFDRRDIVIVPEKAKTRVNRTLSTIHGTINKKLWRLAGYNSIPTIEVMVQELSEYMKGMKVKERILVKPE